MFWHVFRRFSVRGVQKFHVEKVFQRNRQKIRCQGFLDFFCFVAFLVVSQRWEFKNTSKNVLQTDCVKKKYKTNDKKSKTDFFSIFLITFLGVFLGEGKYGLGPFLASDLDTCLYLYPRGSPGFFRRPLAISYFNFKQKQKRLPSASALAA
jgi:hypothetical protein